MHENMPLVTVAIPTYNRPTLLRRALKSISLQNYTNIEVIVADNCSENYRIEDVQNAFKDIFRHCKFVRHQKNIGAANNFLYCLDIAKGDYFMWLADDDEIFGDRYISTLVSILLSRSDVVTAGANWMLMTDSANGVLQASREYASNYWFMRVCKFIWFANDDFFYGLHRIAALRNSSIVSFFASNKSFVCCDAYPFLLDLIIQGKVLYDDSYNAIWVNHDYSEKSYSQCPYRFERALRFLIRRFEIQYLYLKKISNKSYAILPFFFIFSSITLLKEFINIFTKIVLKLKK